MNFDDDDYDDAFDTHGNEIDEETTHQQLLQFPE
jgi:hypothetical protein